MADTPDQSWHVDNAIARFRVIEHHSFYPEDMAVLNSESHEAAPLIVARLRQEPNGSERPIAVIDRNGKVFVDAPLPVLERLSGLVDGGTLQVSPDPTAKTGQWNIDADAASIPVIAVAGALTAAVLQHSHAKNNLPPVTPEVIGSYEPWVEMVGDTPAQRAVAMSVDHESAVPVELWSRIGGSFKGDVQKDSDVPLSKNCSPLAYARDLMAPEKVIQAISRSVAREHIGASDQAVPVGTPVARKTKSAQNQGR